MAVSERKRAARRRRGAEAARQLVADAAAALFARHGYHGTTIENIANASGYSPAAIYKHFRSKEELFGHLWTRMAETMQGIFADRGAAALPFAMRLRWTLHRLTELLETSPDTVISFIIQRPYVSRQRRSPLEQQAYEHYRRHLEQITELMRQGISEGALREGEPEDYALLFIGLLYEFSYRIATRGDPTQASSAEERIVDLFLRGATG